MLKSSGIRICTGSAALSLIIVGLTMLSPWPHPSPFCKAAICISGRSVTYIPGCPRSFIRFPEIDFSANGVIISDASVDMRYCPQSTDSVFVIK